MNPAMFAVKHSLMRTISVVCTLAVIGLIIYGGYIVLWKPHHNPTKTEEIGTKYEYNYEDPFKNSFAGIRVKLWVFKFNFGI